MSTNQFNNDFWIIIGYYVFSHTSANTFNTYFENYILGLIYLGLEKV